MLETLISWEFALSGSGLVDTYEGLEPVWFDIETRKVEAVKPWSQKMRWQTFLVGFLSIEEPGSIFVDVVASDSEDDLLDYTAEMLWSTSARYIATREFDEMVLRGRFTNARRAHSKRPGRWPNLDDVTDIAWTNIRKFDLKPKTWKRPLDVESKEVPEAWEEGEKEIVALHCAKDVMEMFLRDPDVHLTKRLRNVLVRRVETF